MPAVALWTNTSQGPHDAHREGKPREGVGPVDPEAGLGEGKGSAPQPWNPKGPLPLDYGASSLRGRLHQGTQVTSLNYQGVLPSQECHGNGTWQGSEKIL